MGKYNFVGGKVEQGERSMDAAYRELLEETGISKEKIKLYPMMDIIYYHLNFILELYVGTLKESVNLREEENPLEWISLTKILQIQKNLRESKISHILSMLQRIYSSGK